MRGGYKRHGHKTTFIPGRHMSKQVDPRFIEHIDWIETQLAKPEFVTWDRYVVQDNPWFADSNQFNVTVYGWIARDDAHEDFVTVRFHPEHEPRWFEYTTSSEKYTNEFARVWFDVEPAENDGHAGCRRVEDVFELDNVIEL